MVDHMNLWAMAAEAHVIHQGDPEPNGFGQDHGGVMSCLILRLDKAPIFWSILKEAHKPTHS